MKALEALYDTLDFRNGKLLFADTAPTTPSQKEEWLEKGEWLSAAKRAGAESVFFLENNPVVVFANCDSQGQTEIIKTFNRLWSLARPRILFLATPGGVEVLDLAQAPIPFAGAAAKGAQRELMTLARLTDLNNVAQALQDYHRDNVESGKVFEGGRFGDLKHRADNALINDLKTVRRELMTAGLRAENLRYAHALIGRSIFIRYLEDRKILQDDYFRQVAGTNRKWLALLAKPTSRESLDFAGRQALYPRALEDKDFTYALFRSLATDFNGDMFPDVEKEEQAVEPKHLKLIQDLLYGDAGVQGKLFFFSYHFDIVPLALISAIYEEFYHSASNDDDKKSLARQDGAYYTPPVLAEFTLSQVLTPELLAKKPRVLDPACGSGIFLVEAFRRMVRHECVKNGAVPSFKELKQLLGKRIAGIEVNEEAARITAFSLYLALLHYLDPPSILEQIRKGNRLPCLLVAEKKGTNHFDCLWGGGDTFDTKTIEADAILRQHFGMGCADVVVGNPPWGAMDSTCKVKDEESKAAWQKAKKREKLMLEWCEKNAKPIGDKEHSQAFLWRALDFMKEGGHCALLVSAGVLFKHNTTTQNFRREWMRRVCVEGVFNFTHVRKFFFTAISPFVLIHFKKSAQGKTPVAYWSPKQVASLKETRSVLLSKYDLTYLVGQDLTDNKTWKVNWFGRYADTRFINGLLSHDRFESQLVSKDSGRGFQTCGATYSKEQLGNLPSVQSFDRYSTKLDFDKLPDNLYRRGCVGAYFGKKILIHEGIFEKGEAKGRLVARYENSNFAFYRSIYGIKLKSDTESDFLLFTGLLWSSFVRYFFFNTSANWGLWNHKILLDELLQLPIPAKLSGNEADRVITIVQKLRNYNAQTHDLMPSDDVPQKIDAQQRKWEADLDEAVFDLYGFTEDQRDLIRDCCAVTLPFFYQPYESVGAMPAVTKGDLSWLEGYAHTFAKRWKPYLNAEEEIRAEVHLGAHGNMLAFEFFPADATDEWNLKPKENSWGHVLEELSRALPQPMGTSQILLDGVVHAVSADSIIIVKRNEKRFWTRSLAREDAEATLCRRMFDTMPGKGEA